jgi:hypothetical protein
MAGTSPAMTRFCEFSDFESQTAATAIVIAVTARQKPAFLRRDAPEFCSKSRFWKSEGAGNDVRLFRAPEFSREPPDRFGLDRVRYRTGFGMIAFGAFKRSMFESIRSRRYMFQFHSPLTSRTPWALNGGNQ